MSKEGVNPYSRGKTLFYSHLREEALLKNFELAFKSHNVACVNALYPQLRQYFARNYLFAAEMNFKQFIYNIIQNIVQTGSCQDIVAFFHGIYKHVPYLHLPHSSYITLTLSVKNPRVFLYLITREARLTVNDFIPFANNMTEEQLKLIQQELPYAEFDPNEIDVEEYELDVQIEESIARLVI